MYTHKRRALKMAEILEMGPEIKGSWGMELGIATYIELECQGVILA